MEVKAPDAYEFTGIVIPGATLLVAIGLLFDVPSLEPILAPANLGSLGALLIFAFVVGHMLQALGNIIQDVYWRFWDGIPTNWPIIPKREDRFYRALENICFLTSTTRAKVLTDNFRDRKRIWEQLIAQVRIEIHAAERGKRLEVFNGNYGLFRGLVVALLVVASIGWLSEEVPPTVTYGIVMVSMMITVYRMHRFGLYYADELFANAAELASARKREKNNLNAPD